MTIPVLCTFPSSAQLGRLHWEDIPFERLDVSAAVAEDIFRDDEFKRLQIPSIVEKSRQRKAQSAAATTEADKDSQLQLGPFHEEGSVTCYRLGDHVDISAGI